MEVKCNLEFILICGDGGRASKFTTNPSEMKSKFKSDF